MQTDIAREINRIKNNFSLIRTMSKVIINLNDGCDPDLSRKEFNDLIFIQQAQIESLHKDLSRLIGRLGI